VTCFLLICVCTCMWICGHVCGLGAGGWRFVYMYVGWGLGVGDLCTGMWDGVASSTCTKCLHEETVSMEPHIILQMCLNVRIKFAAVDCLL